MIVLAAVGFACNGQGSVGSITPRGVVTESHKQGRISWYICVKAEKDPNDNFNDGQVYCNAKESVDHGEKCPVRAHWPECYGER